MAKEGSRLADFNSAYIKRHGHAPKPLARGRLEAQIETIIKSCGKEPENVVAEMDLEKLPAHEIIRNVQSGDTIVAKAGRGAFSLTFTHLDDAGRLVAMAFANGRYEYEHHLAVGPDEAVKVWCGMLMDFRGFALKAERLPLHQDGGGVLACVRITAKTDASLGPYSIEPAG